MEWEHLQRPLSTSLFIISTKDNLFIYCHCDSFSLYPIWPKKLQNLTFSAKLLQTHNQTWHITRKLRVLYNPGKLIVKALFIAEPAVYVKDI